MPDSPRQPAPDTKVAISRIAVAIPIEVAPDAAARFLGSQRSRWLGEQVDEPEGDRERHVLDLELRVRDHAPRVAFRKAAYVDVGPVDREPGTERIAMSISWHAADAAPLFPVFAGSLVYEQGSLMLYGVYAPPGGTLDRAADEIVVRTAAKATAQRLLERIAEELAASR